MSKAVLPSLDAPLWSRWLLTLLLPAIALVIYWEGQDYDPGLIQLESSNQNLAPPLPETLGGPPRFGQLRAYNAENLYEYINGHAEYYLSAGFQSLTVAEYAAEGAQQPELVVNLYQMGEPLFAFGVLMDELAPDAVPKDGIGSMAFAAGSGLNLIYGPYYAQISSFADGLDLLPAANQLAAALREGLGAVAALDLSFPKLGETLDLYFVKQDYRGLEFLNNVLEQTVRRDGETFTAFMINGNPDQIQETGQALLAFLRNDGIPVQEQTVDDQIYYQVDDPYEGYWFFHLGETRLFGAFTKPTPALLEDLNKVQPNGR
jgi:hypothetical protein